MGNMKLSQKKTWYALKTGAIVIKLVEWNGIYIDKSQSISVENVDMLINHESAWTKANDAGTF